MTVLGSAASFGHPGNPCSGYLVRSPTTSVWLDCGPGTLSAVQEHVALADLHAVVVTHGTRHLLDGLVGGDRAPLDWTDVTDGSSVVIGDLAFSFARTDHPVETLAVRVAWGGRCFAYSADTGTGWSMTTLDPEGEGFDLVLCEASLAEDEAGAVQHLTGSQAGSLARAAGARRLAVTHVYDGTGPDRADAASAAGAVCDPAGVVESGLVSPGGLPRGLPGMQFTSYEVRCISWRSATTRCSRGGWRSSQKLTRRSSAR